MTLSAGVKGVFRCMLKPGANLYQDPNFNENPKTGINELTRFDAPIRLPVKFNATQRKMPERLMGKLSSFQRKFLRGLAHRLDPVVLVGKQGVSDSLIETTDTALRDHELIKVKYIDLKNQKKILAEEIRKRTGSEVVGMIGNVVILFRQNVDEKKRKIELPVSK